MELSLLECFSALDDSRRAEGKRHPLPQSLVMITMAMMSGNTTLRPIAAFLKANQEELCSVLGLQKQRVPGYCTVRTLIAQVDSNQLLEAFTRWAQARCQMQPEELICVDGKALRSTVSDHDNALQDFAAVVSAYCQRSGMVIGARAYNNAERSEIDVVTELITHLGINGALISADALHSTKKRSRRSSTQATTI